ncbi:MAG: DJ-1/PfpI family protein [Candidatus Omnitrophica bacterium]|nr:DJ-1/PfpI family protein [Candidatus Omnitrophota bacterium]
MKTLTGKKIVMIIAAHDFRDEELLVPRAYFQNLGAQVTIASSTTATVTGMLGAAIRPDILYTTINPVFYDAVIFVGGGGAEQYWDDPAAHRIARDTLFAHKVLAAICIAPVTLAKAGVLQGKKATVWMDEQSLLKANGADYTGQEVTVDGSIVTADGPAHALPFSRSIADLLLP